MRDEESETQRKAHAKRVRETRRSTQGVTLEEIKSAEQFVKSKNGTNNNNTGETVSDKNSIPLSPLICYSNYMIKDCLSSFYTSCLLCIFYTRMSLFITIHISGTHLHICQHSLCQISFGVSWTPMFSLNELFVSSGKGLVTPNLTIDCDNLTLYHIVIDKIKFVITCWWMAIWPKLVTIVLYSALE